MLHLGQATGAEGLGFFEARPLEVIYGLIIILDQHQLAYEVDSQDLIPVYRTLQSTRSKPPLAQQYPLLYWFSPF